MNSVYGSSDYRHFIDERCRLEGSSFRALSVETRIHPSYFSRVMSGAADFSAEQAYRLGMRFSLEGPELDYLLLLREHDACSDRECKAYLAQKIARIRDDSQKLVRRLAKATSKVSLTSEDKIRAYYDDPLTARVHMFLTIGRYQRDRALLGRKLGVSLARLNAEISKLARLGIVSLDGESAIASETFIHLDESHPASFANHTHWRLEAIERLRRRESSASDYSLSVCFSANEAAKTQIRERFKQFVLEAQRIVDRVNAPDDVYFMTFDIR